MTPDQAIDYIKRNRQFLNLSGIAKDAGIHPTQLIGYINGKPRKSGYMPPMSNEKLWDLAKVVKKLKEG